jgi:acetolactate synthase small subunit
MSTATATITGLTVDFHNIPGAMMRVLNSFTRRGLVIQAVHCGPVNDHHRAHVVVEAQPITMEQTIRELESTVGVDSVAPITSAQIEALLKPSR